MFVQFHSAFSETDRVAQIADEQLLANVEPYAHGFTSLLTDFGGASFDNGVYRIHRISDIANWTSDIENAMPKYASKIVCFAYDWLGRHFALNKGAVENNQMHILLLEPGTGEALKIPASFSAFHNIELVQYRNEVLAADFYTEWLKNGGLPPRHNECVGYKIPLFLDGSDTVDNLETSDMDVYWTICGQLLNGKTAG